MAFQKTWKRNYYTPGKEEPFRLSRSKIDLFIECPRCFYLDRRLGVSRPQGFPFNINSAVDLLFKKEFDVHRKDQSAHPYMLENNIPAIPFAHAEMDTWRENFTGAQTLHKETNFIITGAVDDIWIYTDGPDKGKLIIVDYKATSKDGEITLDAEWQDGYRRQMETYQWIFRRLGFDVSNTGYFVYANALRDRPNFSNKLDFSVKLFPHTGDTSWIEKTLESAKTCLDDNRIPKEKETCEYCAYRTKAGNAFKDHTEKNSNKGKNMFE